MRHFIAFAFAIVMVSPAIAARAQTGPNEPSPQPWGTWILSVHQAGTATLPVIVTLHKEGTANSTPGNLFTASSSVSPLHDVWERTGPATVGTTCMAFLFDPNMRTLLGFLRARSALQLDDDDHMSGRFYFDFLACPTPSTCPDPVDPIMTWHPWGNPAGYVTTAVRLRRVEAGPLQ